ncbi:hypothetical protein LPB86_18180 [Pedobacter sp. MC2016-14]|uniref:hypothetical protein n=1 Tax=Pedobacter sp. MC2016-14 TaxID=2897327 RepID=UPI001E38A32F|nr:hypothetical protein [Pedobacter sp. MC2016-14]MCD0490175.1 hypothetical protein [Pedobacter sp. MC2016-14]
MITPENEAAFDNEDQKSQQDIQSDGIEVTPQSEEDRNASDIDKLNQADRASEASYTLDVDRGIAPEKD